MLWKTHILGGMTAAFVLAAKAAVPGIVMVSAPVAAAGLVSLLPDIEDPDSWIGRRIPIIPHILKTTVRHRGPLHSWPGVALCAFAFWWLHLRYPLFGVFSLRLLPYIIIGYLSHLLLDTFNPPGVPWLWPLPARFSIPVVEARSLLERFVVIPVMFAMLCVSILFWAVH